MSNQVQFPVFNFNSSQVRVIVDPNQEPWFCGSDVCDVLGYENSRTTIQKHCKAGGVSKRYTPTQSGEQEMNFINEPNLYRLIIKSRKPEAEKFEAWVFEEVLPQIRKTGKYALQNSAENRPLAIEHKTENTQSLSDSELYTLAKVWREVETMRYWLNALQEPLKWLKSPYMDDALEAQTFRSDIEDFRNIVIKYSGHIQKSSSPNTTITPFEQAILDLRKKWLRLNTAREIIQPIF